MSVNKIPAYLAAFWVLFASLGALFEYTDPSWWSFPTMVILWIILVMTVIKFVEEFKK